MCELPGRAQILIKFIDQMNEFVGRIVSVVAVIFAAIIIYDVFMRYALNDPTRWALTLRNSYMASIS